MLSGYFDISTASTDTYCKYHMVFEAYKPWIIKFQYICSAQFRNMRNLEIAQRILGILKLRTNLEIACAISRLRTASAQSRDCATALRNLEVTLCGACEAEPSDIAGTRSTAADLVTCS